MENFAGETCTPCRGGVEPLSRAEAEAMLQQLPGWQLIEDNGQLRLQREFAWANFAEAIEFTNAVAEIAEAAGHHPRLVTEWGTVCVQWWTHVIGGLHRNDFIMAARTDGCLPG